MKATLVVQRSLGIASLALLGMSLAMGQATQRPTNPGGGSTTPTVPTTTSPTTNRGTSPSQLPGQTQQPMELQRPMFMSGKVMLDDGTPPSDSVRIERVCGGRVIPEANTDRKGRFSFQMGQNATLMADASTSGPGMRGMDSQSSNPMGGMRERELFNCELRAQLAGYRSDVVNLANRKFMDNPDVGTIILHRLGNVEGLTISATSLNAPKDAKKLFEKGHEALGKGKLEDAQKHLEKAVELYPKYAAAWYELGMVNERQKNLDAARKAFSQSMASDGKYMNPYDALAQIEARDQKWQDVADITDKMIHLNPVDFPRAYFYNAVAKLNLKKLDEAEKSAKQLVDMDKRHQFPRGEQVLGVILAQKQDYTGAADHIRKFISFAQPGTDVDMAKKQLAELEKSLAARETQP